jgi:hypothetical protein
LTIQWTAERATSWPDGERVDQDVRAAARWRLRLISDQMNYGAGMAPVAEFCAVIDSSLEIWLRPRGSDAPLEKSASGPGIDVEIVEDITTGLVHDVTTRARPADDGAVRWSCSCGTRSRGSAPPDEATAAADEHRRDAMSRRPGRFDLAVTQRADGTWEQSRLPIARRFRLRARSDFSEVRVHRLGLGEEFELSIDGQLGLWTRTLGTEAALRRDESGRGVTLMILEYA